MFHLQVGQIGIKEIANGSGSDAWKLKTMAKHRKHGLPRGYTSKHACSEVDGTPFKWTRWFDHGGGTAGSELLVD